MLSFEGKVILGGVSSAKVLLSMSFLLIRTVPVKCFRREKRKTMDISLNYEFIRKRGVNMEITVVAENVFPKQCLELMGSGECKSST